MLNRPDRKAESAFVVVLRIDFRGIEVQVVGIGSRVEPRRPVVPVRATVVERRTIVVPGSREESEKKCGYHLLRPSDGIRI